MIPFSPMIGGSAAPIAFVAAGDGSSSPQPTLAQLGARAGDFVLAAGGQPRINGTVLPTITTTYGYGRRLTQADLAYPLTGGTFCFAIYRNLPILSFVRSGTGNRDANAPSLTKAASHKGLVVTGNYGNQGLAASAITSPTGFTARSAASPYFISDRLTPPNTPYVDNTPIRTGTAQTALYLFEARQS